MASCISVNEESRLSLPMLVCSLTRFVAYDIGI
jgi:hypothetical protein